jgi:hypothetical protein
MLQRLDGTLRVSLALVAITLLAILPAQLAAQNYNEGQNSQDPPGRVARIRYVQGSVSFEPAGTQDWVPAITNRPVTLGDQLWVDANSRAELDLGSSIVRIGQNTGMSFLNLDDNAVQIQLTQGDLDIRVRRLRQNTVFEVDTPNQAFSVYQPGTYRVEASQDGNSTMVTVRQGQGQVTGAGQAYTLDTGQAGSFTGDGTNSLVGQLTDPGSPDDFDRWAQSRDAAYDRSVSARYVSPDMVGYEDLDNNGSWSSDPTYGSVWYPNSVPAGWAPYRDGHWAWISPWGWTWVDDQPWGYAPFHYGRWAYMRNRWGWVPGPVQAEPVYAPALVAFIGGAGFGISISAGGGGYGPGGGDVGWFPLGPREVYVPSYYATPQYVQRVNTSNTVVSTTTVTNVYNNVVNNNQVTNITYVNRAVPNAVTVVPQTVVRSAQPVQRAVVQVDPQRIAAAPVASRPAVVPTQASVAGTPSPAAAHMARPPAAVMERKVVAKTTPPPPPVPFAKQEPALAKQAGRPLPPQEVKALRPTTAAEAHPQVKLAPPAKPATLARGPAQPQARPPAAAPAQQQAQQRAAEQQQAQQQAAEQAREQQAQKQTAQQQAQQKAAQQQAQQKATEQQQAQQQAAEQAREQQAQKQTAQQQAQQKASQEQAQQRAAQQQAAQQQNAERAREQAQQHAAQQTAQQQAAQQRTQQTAQQKPSQQQSAQEQAQQRAQQQSQQQAAQRGNQQQAQQAAQQAQNRPPQQQRPPQPAPQARPQQGQPPAQAKPNKPQTPEEKAREEQQKKEQKPPPPPE